jgi:hypothetical protein
MVLRLNDSLFRTETIGMPFSHAAAFKTVAAAQRCMVLVRATGPTCLQLLEQGYDTKGFRIHGKSCDWGPMAGFALRDPRLNKSGMGKAGYNADQHAESLSDHEAQAGWVATVTPLKIYDERRRWLMEHAVIAVQPRGDDRWEGQATHPTGINFHYSLIRDRGNPDLWGIYLDRTKNARGFQQDRGAAVVRYDTKYGDMYEPLLAMSNPAQHRHIERDENPQAFLNAVTGDYDLFAIWPYVGGPKGYDPHGLDRRVLGTAKAYSQRHQIESRERLFTVSDPEKHPMAGSQGTKLGNITDRIYEVGQYLNSVIGGSRCHSFGRVWGPFPRRNVIWHSDEAARPFVDDADLPILAIAPTGHEIGVESIQDFRELVDRSREAGLRVTLAEGWTLNPDARKPNRLGAAYANLVPDHWRGQQIQVPAWYNR